MGGIIKTIGPGGIGGKLANPAALLGLPDPVGDALGVNDQKTKQKRSSLLTPPKPPSSLTKIL